MKNLYTILLLLMFSQISVSQILEITHQSNGTILQLPIESIDSVKVNQYNNYLLKTVYQNNGNILGIALQDVDSISYVIPDVSSLPTLNTLDIFQETSSSVFTGGNVLSDGGSTVIQRGVCWNTSPNPTIANSFTIDGTGTGNYTSHAIPLNASTSYYLRSYATNENGTAYGNELTFTTPNSNQEADLPIVLTGDLVYEDGLIALGSGSVTISSGAVSSRGICWAIGATPTINSSHSIEGVGTGDFSSSLENLQTNTLYRVRAYATSSAGTAYGDEVLFRTHDLPSAFSISAYNYLEYSTVALEMAVQFDGNSDIIEHGVCWSTQGQPTIEDNVSVLGSGEGSFQKTFTNLNPENVYYFRPYATNGIGTSYGSVRYVSLDNTIQLEQNIYSLIYEPASDHNHFAQKSIDIFSDIISCDMALSGSAYGWYINSANLISTIGVDHADNNYLYNYYMEIIHVVNPLITALTPFGSVPTNDEDRWLLGQAQALRGYAYFYLTQLFQEKFNPDEEILPLQIGTEYDYSPDPTGDIYSQIISDLNSGVNLLNNYTSPDKLHINKTIAQGLLAYTHAAMGNYAEAKPLADAVIASGYPLTTAGALAYPGAGSGFNDVNSPSWIWAFDLTEDLGHQLIDWWGQMDAYTYSYQWAGDYKSIDDALYAQIESDDVRKNQFGTGTSALQPINKFFDPNRTIGGQYIITTDLLFMRVEEFYLLSAESAAMLGNDAAAKSTMVELLDNRMADAAGTVNSLSGTQLQDFIYLQTKIELWGEGKTYLAMKRNQATVTRGTNHVYRAGESFAYDSDELTFDMPSLEDSNFTPPALNFLNCESLEQTDTDLAFSQVVTDFTFQIPYVTNAGGDYEAIDFYSTGVEGLTASIVSGSFNEFEGILEFNVTGTPLSYGTAEFYIYIANKSCNISFEIIAVENCTAYPTILTINFDENPQETYWKIFSTSDSSTPLFSGGLDASYTGMTSIQVPFCLEDGDYALTFFDTNNNGFPLGSYSLDDIYGNNYACGVGMFTDPDLTLFTSGLDSGNINLSIEIELDNYPEEFYWYITDASGNVVASPGPYAQFANPYSNYPSGYQILVELCLPAGSYTFYSYDDYGDGGGPIIVTSGGVTIYETDGTYAGGENTDFTLCNQIETWYIDADGDGYSNYDEINSCERPENGFSLSELSGGIFSDCDDSNASVYPGALEIADFIDNNCDGQIDEGFDVLASLTNLLTGGSSKTWKVKSDVGQHFGLGPVGGLIPCEWYGAGPDEKVGTGMYDDRWTFNSDGTIHHITNGTIYGRSAQVYAELGNNGTGSEDGADLYNYIYSDYYSNWNFTNPGQISINLTGNNGFFGYYTGGSHSYELWDYTDNELYLRTVDGAGEFTWWFILTKLDETDDFGILFEEDFEAYANLDQISGDWTNYVEEGSRDWTARTTTDTGNPGSTIAQIGAYNSGDASTVSWLITPQIDLDAQEFEFFDFESSNSFSDGSELELLISTDWDGTDAGVSSATWTSLPGTIVPDATFYQDWIYSGLVDLSPYSGTAHIAFKYTANSANYGTYEIDNVKVFVQN